MTDPKDFLIGRFEKRCLGHFYLLRAHSKVQDPDQFLNNWIQDFLVKAFQKEGRVKSHKDGVRQLQMGHPDILVIKKEDAQKDYTLKDGDFDEFFQFQQYTSLELSWRFIIVHDAHQIGKVIANKLLKVLEEPQKNTTIFFLQPNSSKLLPTIESRAICLTLFPPENSPKEQIQLNTKDDFLTWLKNKNYSKGLVKVMEAWVHRNSSPQMVLDKLKAKKELQRELLSMLLEWESVYNSSYAHKNDFLQNLKWFERSQTFHNAPLERVYTLLNQQFPY